MRIGVRSEMWNTTRRAFRRSAAADLMADVLEGALGVIAGADFFTTEVRTWRSLVTYYTVFVIDLAPRRVHVLGSTPHPTELSMGQMVRLVPRLTTAY
jgi:hypothetical protein